ncbi:hypothetical protein GUJ93_ZPchr0004g39983 [Zizania palustris]|uniref:DUF4005 domain-containing protein n=1 Tax=Zizania palustris TaxID=103762 RepID=A0A8J5V9F1_ZIZPA|nr:hypothetical protein GUJ93_ZPchr0004g39983 [Zizania palustris]
MGWASRWLRGLLGGGKKASSSSGSGFGQPKPAKEKKRWGFGKSFREKSPAHPPPPPPPPPQQLVQRAVTPRRAYPASDDGDDEQSKRAIAVAAATAAVAEAAVAAAQAAAAVVRLTSSGRCVPTAAKREELAAVRIQAAFRGYLARRALKALRGLVKLQALVRGNIVRRQAAETLRCMHALVRVQRRARACRAIRSQHVAAHPRPPTPEKYGQAAHDGVPRNGRSGSLKASSSKTPGSERLSRERSESCGRNWLDRWVEERYMDDEKNAKILEKSRSYATMPESPSKDSTAVQQSVPSPPSVGMPEALSPLRMAVDIAELCDSPQFFSATSRPGSSRRGAFTPTKSECSRSLFGGYSDYPNYMANTESFRAKARSHSAPKQRPQYEKSGSLRKASAQASGPGSCAQAAQRSTASLHAKFTNKAYPGSGRLDRLGMPVKY